MSGHMFTADLHFGHKLVSELRGYGSVEFHDEAMIARTNRAVTKDTILWILGDLGVSTSSYVIDQARRIKCRKILVAGNHDAFHPMHRNAWKQQKKLAGVFEAVLPYQKLRIGKREVMLNHLPYAGGGDHTAEERYDQYRMPDLGMPLLCGHVHDAWKFNGRQFNVGVDVNGFNPVSSSTVEQWLDGLDEGVHQ